MDLPKAVAELSHTLALAFNATANHATLAAVLDGYRGDLWVWIEVYPHDAGSFAILSARRPPHFAGEGVARARQITITEEGAQVLLKQFTTPGGGAS